MVGNDVVDLKKAAIESNWQHPRFLDKIFTLSEKEIIEQATNQFQTIWRLWSMKESGYKIYVQQFRNPFFNPKKIECKFIDNSQGEVCIDNEIYKTITECTSSYIYTTAYIFTEATICYKTFKVTTENSSKESRELLLRLYAEKKNLQRNKLEVRKEALGIPKLFYNGMVRSNSISITHHGQFAGVSFD